jgi:hypothetical protein
MTVIIESTVAAASHDYYIVIGYLLLGSGFASRCCTVNNEEVLCIFGASR